MNWSFLSSVDRIINIDWLIGSILYDLLKLFLLTIVIGGFVCLYRAVSVSIKILNKNRDTRNGLGKHCADRFIDIWFSPKPLQYLKDGGMYPFPNSISSCHPLAIIDGELDRLGLISIEYNDIYGSYILPIRTIRNKVALIVSIFWLSFIVGDGKKFYVEKWSIHKKK